MVSLHVPKMGHMNLVVQYKKIAACPIIVTRHFFSHQNLSQTAWHNIKY